LALKKDIVKNQQKSLSCNLKHLNILYPSLTLKKM